MESQSIEYVAAGDTIADGALKDVASASLAATTSILLAILVIACFYHKCIIDCNNIIKVRIFYYLDKLDTL